MKSIIKPLVILFILAIAAFYLLRPARDNQAPAPTASAEQPPATSADDTAISKNPPASPQTNQAAEPGMAQQNPAQSASTDSSAGQNAASTPASNVQPEAAAPEPVANSQPEPIVVPQSYPVQDAAKYFIPADQRSPGNLGGPPPPPPAVMEALTAPSAPGGLAPPPAPGN